MVKASPMDLDVVTFDASGVSDVGLLSSPAGGIFMPHNPLDFLCGRDVAILSSRISLQLREIFFAIIDRIPTNEIRGCILT